MLDFVRRLLLVSYTALMLAGCTLPQAPAPTLSYQANGGNGLVSKPRAFPGRVAFVASTVTLVREGYQFAGWNTSPVATGPDFVGEVFLAGDTVLYARWVADDRVSP
jgi:uncharacterized repeat protein (TIGR02543 family)